MYTGKFIHSTDETDEDLFSKALILLVESNNKGETGFILNKPFPRSLNELTEFSRSRSFPLYTGGPVDQEHIYFIHRRPDLIPGGRLIDGDLQLGGDFEQALKGINNSELTTQDIKLFLGYCGWENGDLDEEINAGSWTLSDDQPVF
jgi:putative transcriptional regulator